MGPFCLEREDGLPVLLDLYDPAPGPILIAGDRGSGKTALLQSLARLSNLQDPGDIQFGVVTTFFKEWSEFETLPNCLGVWPANHPSTQAFLSQLVSWADALPETRQAGLLLWDGLDLLADSDILHQQAPCWLLVNGAKRQIWPVVTVNSASLSRLQDWLEFFYTRILGQVKYIHNARLLLDDPLAGLSDLHPGTQFCLSQPGSRLKFWLPSLE